MPAGLTSDGVTVETVSIENGPAQAELMTYGASLTAYYLEGFEHSLVLGSPDLESYFGPLQYFGAIVGPVANRIAGGRAPLGDTTLELAVNENGNALHGGPNGLSEQIWTIADRGAAQVTFALHHSDGKDGLPGPLHFDVTYTIEESGALTVDVVATSGVLTLCNPAFHGYWCLSENGLCDHRLSIAADYYLPTDTSLIPTGEVAPVANTLYDLSRPTQLPAACNLDTNYCLNGQGKRPVARLETDRLALILETNAPGLQVFDAAQLDTEPAKGHQGVCYGPFAGLALEPQFWPDAPNHSGFPSIILNPEARFHQYSRFSFVRKEIPARP